MPRRTQDHPGQLELLWRDAEGLRADLEARTGFRVHLTITDNTSTLMSVKQDRARRAAKLRVHHMFLSAEDSVIQALAEWIKRPRSKRHDGSLNRFLDDHADRVRSRPRPPAAVNAQGRHFDLASLFDEVNAAQFDRAVTAAITWGAVPVKRRRRSIRFGSFHAAQNLIRIHPLLDQAFVPRYFIRYIVFHEMLHAALDREQPGSGRRRVHPAAFKRRERAYPDYDRAMACENDPKTLRKLLRG
jgi:hypothetical protein